jgi:hypothetical protein
MKALLESTPGLANMSYLWSNTAGAIAAQDPAAALTWAQSLETPVARRRSIQQVLEKMVWQDPAAAMAQAATLQEPGLTAELLPGLLQRWAGQDADAVLAWAATATGPEREVALLEGSLAKADNDPAASAAVVESMLSAKGGANPGTSLNNGGRSRSSSRTIPRGIRPTRRS